MGQARSMTNRAVVSIGVAGAVGPDLAASLASAVEEAGFHALWVNDTPGADALAVLEAAARATTTLRLATGVIPIDRRSAPQIAADVRARGLPQDRLSIGIGAGSLWRGAILRVGDAAVELRSALSARIVVGALGPKMRAKAVAASDGLVLNWLTPDIAREQAAEAHAASPSTRVALYVRTALDAAASSRLNAETERYAAVPAYAANFTRQHIRAEQTVLHAGSGDVAASLNDYRTGLDEIVLRAITPGDDLGDYLRFVEEAGRLL